MNFYTRLARPLLFRLDPENAHRLTLGALNLLPRLAPHFLPAYPPAKPVTLMGLTFANRLGLAAGLDKNGTAARYFDRLGFGHLEIGTVTPVAQSGNPRPRLFRLVKEQALINRMGFNNDGATTVCQRLAAVKPRLRACIGVNIGKNKTTPNANAVDDYLAAFAVAKDVADYLTINISSPNTAGLRDLQHGAALRQLLSALKNAQREYAAGANGRYLPLVVKIAPDNEPADLRQIIDAIGENAIDGVIATNTTIDKSAVSTARWGNEEGGLSGAPLRAKATAITHELRRALPNIALIAAGGVMNGDDYRAKRDAGADLVQIYSGLIYRGTALVAECLAAE